MSFIILFRIFSIFALSQPIIAEDPVLLAPSSVLANVTSESQPVKMSIWAKKAGGRMKTTTPTTPPPSSNKMETSSTFSDESLERESSQEEDLCGSSEYLHIRSHRCVPLICPRKRNSETGECFKEETNNWRGWVRNSGRSYSYNIRQRYRPRARVS